MSKEMMAATCETFYEYSRILSAFMPRILFSVLWTGQASPRRGALRAGKLTATSLIRI